MLIFIGRMYWWKVSVSHLGKSTDNFQGYICSGKHNFQQNRNILLTWNKFGHFLWLWQGFHQLKTVIHLYLKKKKKLLSMSLKMNWTSRLLLKYLYHSIFHQIQCQFLIKEIVNKKWDSWWNEWWSTDFFQETPSEVSENFMWGRCKGMDEYM